MPNAVTPNIKLQREWANTDDCFDVRLHYSNLTATLKTSMLCKIPGPTFIMHGKNGSFVKYGLDVQEATLDGGAISQGENWGKESKEIWCEIDVDYKGVSIKGAVESELGDYREYFANVRDVIWQKGELFVKPEEARDVIIIIEIAFQSSKEGCTIDI